MTDTHEETGDEKWTRLFRETTPEQLDRLEKLFDEAEAEGLLPLRVDVDFSEPRTLVDLANEQREFLDSLRDAGFVDIEAHEVGTP